MTNGISDKGVVGPLGPGGIRPSKGINKLQESQKLDGAQKTRNVSDNASISTNAAEVSRYQEIAKLHREAFGPQDRTGKLEEIKSKIAVGHYDSDSFIDKLAGSIVDENVSSSASTKEVDTAKRRSEEGYYERPEVIDKTSENLLKQVLGL